MENVKNIIGKCARKLVIVMSLTPLFLRYYLYGLFSYKPSSYPLHEFSQLMVLSPQIRQFGMTSDTERAYFKWYTKHIYTGCGSIVDLGCWLGSTTIPLASGLSKSKQLKGSLRNIHAFDDFIWKPSWDLSVAGTKLAGRYRVGESFLDEFNARIAPWRDYIKVHPVDLRKSEWDGGNIEFLLIDAMKSWELANSIINHFFPALIPGSSFILHQDFAHWFTPWIHLIQWHFREYFEFVYDIPRSSSVVFKLHKSIPSKLLTNNYLPCSFAIDEIHSAFNYSFNLVSKSKHPNIAAAKVMLFINIGDLSQAKKELDKYRTEGLSFTSDLSIVKERLSAKLLKIK